MLGSHWQFGLLIGLIAVHALIVYHAYRLRERGAAISPGPVGENTDLVDTGDGIVECPDCGTTNELGYRYCRSCVTELPATMDFERHTDSPLERFTR